MIHEMSEFGWHWIALIAVVVIFFGYKLVKMINDRNN